jgi:hypothetical protein
MLSTILLIFALVFFVLATAGVPSPPRFSFLPAGLTCWVLSILLGGTVLHF